MQNALKQVFYLYSSVACNIFTGSAVISMLTERCSLAERPSLFSPGNEVPQNGTFWMSPLFNRICWSSGADCTNHAQVKSEPSLVVV